MTGLQSAIAFLTTFPVGSSRANHGQGIASARAWFPAVGLLVGTVLAAFDLLIRWGYRAGINDYGGAAVVAQVLVGAVVVAALVLITGALHLDGFMDTCDALLGGSSPKHRMQILKDPHVGTFAVVGVVCLLLVKVAAISALPWQSRPWILILVPCLSRGAMLLVMEVFPYVGSNGLGVDFLQKQGRWHLPFGLTVALVAGTALMGPWGLALAALAAIVGWSVGRWATTLLGGLTGDVYGAVNELVEATALLFAALVTAWTPAAPFFTSIGLPL